MALKQQLQLKQQQKLSPLQMQVIKLTELPSLELEERIKQELEDNPALEEGQDYEDINEDFDNDSDENISQEDITLGDYLNDEEVPDFRLKDNNKLSSDRQEIPFAIAESLNEHLLEQLGECDFNDDDLKSAEYIIGNIDESGYLDRSLSAISDDLIFQQNIDISIDNLEKLLKIIQTFDPAGIGARDLKECLLLQLERKENSDIVDLSKRVIKDYFDEFSKKHYEKIIHYLKIDEATFKEIIQEITTLNPKPGNNWGDSLAQSMNTIVPDFIVEVYNG